MYGAKIEKGVLYEGNSNYYLAYQNSSPLPYVLIPGHSYSNPITSEFQNSTSKQMIIMPWAQTITTNEVNEENATVVNSVILMTSPDCYFITDYTKGITSATLKE